MNKTKTSTSKKKPPTASAFGPTSPISPLVIGIVGFKRSGKDTVSQLLSQFLAKREFRCGDRLLHIKTSTAAFADPLKQELYEKILQHDGISVKDIDLPENKERYRPLVISLAHYRRAISGQDFYVRMMEAQLDRTFERCSALNQIPVTIISDLRYPMEVELVHRRGGILIRVDRKSVEPAKTAELHESEHLLNRPPIDTHYSIDNNGTLTELEERCRNLGQELLAEIRRRHSA